MTIDEYCDFLLKIALGYLGWSEEQALHSDMNAILAAWQGRSELLKSMITNVASILMGKDISEGELFISSKDDTRAPNLTPKLFDAMFPGEKNK